MPALKRVQDKIAELAGRRKDVTLEEIQWVVNRLHALGYDTNVRGTQHNMMFRVGTAFFNICSHNKGSKQLKSCYVKNFLSAMIELGLYEE